MDWQDYIKGLAKRHGLTLDQLADALNMTRSGLYGIFKSGNLAETHAQRMAELFNITPAEVRYGHQPAVSITHDLAKAVLVGIEKNLSDTRTTLTPDKKARLFCRLYEHYAQRGERPTASDVANLLSVLDALAD